MYMLLFLRLQRDVKVGVVWDVSALSALPPAFTPSKTTALLHLMVDVTSLFVLGSSVSTQ